jgi:hypothetical protein
MRQQLFELHIPGQNWGDFIIVEVPTPGEDDFYPQVTSLSWFRDRELKRAFPDVSSGKLINGMDWMQYARTVKYCSDHHVSPRQTMKDYLDSMGVDINTVPVCKGVWDFYEKIGYNKKSKKYK